MRLPVHARLRIASPCSADWSAMAGDDRRRLCEACGLHVHNVAAMTAPEIEALAATTAPRVCVRLYRRADGTVLTADCPVGRRARRREPVRRAGMAAALLGLWAATEHLATQVRALVRPTAAAVAAADPPWAVPPPGEWIAGEMTVEPDLRP